MSKTRYTVTKRHHFEAFVREFKKAARELGVNDVRVSFAHEAINAYAQIGMNATSHTAHITFCKMWEMGRPLTAAELRDTARHEAMHVALMPLKEVGDSRWCTSDEFTSALERTVRRLCHAKWKGPEG